MAKKPIPKKVIKEINKFLEILKEDKLPMDKVILYGSYAKGNPRRWSDIDLCVVSPKFKDAWGAMEYLWKRRKIFDVNYTIEPIGFSPKDFRESSSLINEIKKTGIVIYKK